MTCCTELADYQWLTGADACGVLADLAGRDEPLHASASRLRKHHSASRTHLLLEQVELRRRGAVKFTQASEMFFTRLGLEQATDQWVAAYKAKRFSGRGPRADLCCGIGGDLVALAQVGGATGVDRNPVAAHFAAANAVTCGVSQHASVKISDVDRFDARGLAAWHIDPDRRPQGDRTTALTRSSPDADAIERLLTASPDAAVKLAPAADVPPRWSEQCELEWISRDRQCRQLVAWHGALARSPGRRRATLLSPGGECLRSVLGEPGRPLEFVEQLDRYLYEPDPAVLAADLAGALAAERGLAAFAVGVAYLTGPTALDDPALACFEVLDVLPLNMRQISAYVRERRIGRLEIKKRGVEHGPEEVRRQLQLDGDGEATLVLTMLNRRRVAILAVRTQLDCNAGSPLPTSGIPHPAP